MLLDTFYCVPIDFSELENELKQSIFAAARVSLDRSKRMATSESTTNSSIETTFYFPSSIE